jgi:hypothetical protein
VLALLLGRGLRYFAEGILAVRYGDAALLFLMAHKIGFALSVLAALLLLYVAGRLLFRGSEQQN